MVRRPEDIDLLVGAASTPRMSRSAQRPPGEAGHPWNIRPRRCSSHEGPVEGTVPRRQKRFPRFSQRRPPEGLSQESGPAPGGGSRHDSLSHAPSRIPIERQHPNQVALVYGPVVPVQDTRYTRKHARISRDPLSPVGWSAAEKPLEFRLAEQPAKSVFAPEWGPSCRSTRWAPGLPMERTST